MSYESAGYRGPGALGAFGDGNTTIEGGIDELRKAAILDAQNAAAKVSMWSAAILGGVVLGIGYLYLSEKLAENR